MIISTIQTLVLIGEGGIVGYAWNWRYTKFRLIWISETINTVETREKSQRGGTFICDFEWG